MKTINQVRTNIDENYPLFVPKLHDPKTVLSKDSDLVFVYVAPLTWDAYGLYRIGDIGTFNPIQTYTLPTSEVITVNYEKCFLLDENIGILYLYIDGALIPINGGGGGGGAVNIYNSDGTIAEDRRIGFADGSILFKDFNLFQLQALTGSLSANLKIFDVNTKDVASIIAKGILNLQSLNDNLIVGSQSDASLTINQTDKTANLEAYQDLNIRSINKDLFLGALISSLVGIRINSSGQEIQIWDRSVANGADVNGKFLKAVSSTGLCQWADVPPTSTRGAQFTPSMLNLQNISSVQAIATYSVSGDVVTVKVSGTAICTDKIASFELEPVPSYPAQNSSQPVGSCTGTAINGTYINLRSGPVEYQINSNFKVTLAEQTQSITGNNRFKFSTVFTYLV